MLNILSAEIQNHIFDAGKLAAEKGLPKLPSFCCTYTDTIKKLKIGQGIILVTTAWYSGYNSVQHN